MESDIETSPQIPKSSQDMIGRYLAKWRNAKVVKEIIPPFLDIACGDNLLAKHVSKGFGIDVVNYGTADILVKDFNELPFKQESFESVSIVASLNYVDRPEKVLSEAARILKPGGILILTLTNQVVGKFWHMFREPWAKYPGFSFSQLKILNDGSGLRLTKRSRFMVGLNNLYIYTKL